MLEKLKQKFRPELERLKLWYWKWFKPRRYWRHVAEELRAAYEAGLKNPDPAVVTSVAHVAGLK